FIGNSYTYVNDLPGTLYQLALAGGDTIIYDSNTVGGYTLQLHSTNATTLYKISSQPWDYVVLQEQSQIPSFPPQQVDTMFYPYAIFLDSLIHANDSCTQTVFYMTWGRKYGDASNCAFYPPVCTYAGMQAGLRSSYLEISDSLRAIVSPAGISFQNSMLADSNINLYQTDFSHPSIEGTYLIACTFYASVFRKTPAGNSFISTLTPVVAAFLQNIAAHTVLDSLDTWHIGTYEPHAAFAMNQLTALTYQFISDSLNASTHYWSFNGSATGSSTTHTFPGNGNYTITHIACNDCTCDTSSQNLFITPFSTNDLDEKYISIDVLRNPVKDYLAIRITDDHFRNEIYSGKLFDLFGRQVMTLNLPPNRETIFSISFLDAGTYFLRVTNDRGKNGLRKIVVL
ncbi:MAG: T9SS type A sorting domain-containing protein, partial [Bacteroidetes bacterium]|nr:T9SS type A sorting domain-containing protein [Bacteroidota bacterium]